MSGKIIYKKIPLEELVLLSQKSDYKALEELIRREQKNIFATFAYLSKTRENIADLTQEVDCRQWRGPVQVVDDAGSVLALEAEERGDLVADVVDPAGNHFGGVQLAFAGLEAGVADHAGGAA